MPTWLTVLRVHALLRFQLTTGYNRRMTEDAAPNAMLPPPLRMLAGSVLERALNQALALDIHTRQQLTALNGQRGAGCIYADRSLPWPSRLMGITASGRTRCR